MSSCHELVISLLPVCMTRVLAVESGVLSVLAGPSGGSVLHTGYPHRLSGPWICC